MLFGTMGVASYMRENVQGFDWDIAPVPARVQQRQEGSNAVFVVPGKSQNPEQAWNLLQFMVSRQAGEIFAGAGAYIPNRYGRRAEGVGQRDGR